MRTWSSCPLRGTVLLALALAGAASSGCGDSTEECPSHTQTFCHRGALYWVDGCGNLEEIEKYCDCGCTQDATDCLGCECTCSQASDCCDGCYAVHQGQVCDDGDPATVNELCQDGSCIGWNPADLAAPASPEQPVLPASPAEPAPIQLRSWVCPPGWNSAEHEALLDENGLPFSWCRPPPLPRLRFGAYVTPLLDGELDGDRPVCEPALDGSYPLLGHADCRPIGDPCPAGTFPDVPGDVPGNRVYVLAGAVGGNGTQAAPFGLVAEGLAAASPGDVVVIGAGTYPEALTVGKNITLWGACVQQTFLDAPGPYSPTDVAVVSVTTASQVTVRNLTITGTQKGVRVNHADGMVTLEGVWIHEATAFSILASAGTVRIVGTLIDSTIPTNNTTGMGVAVWDGARLEMEASTVERNSIIGVSLLDPGTTSSIIDVAVRETQSRVPDLTEGWGLEVQSGVQLTVSRALFERNRSFGVLIGSSGTTASLEDVVVHHTRGQESNQHLGVGLDVEAGAQVTLTRGLIEWNRASGLAILSDGTRLDCDDLVIRETQGTEQLSQLGRGMEMADGAQLTIRRGLLEKNHEVGMALFSTGTEVTLEDLALLDTRSQVMNGQAGFGMFVNDGVNLTLTRGLIAGNRLVAVSLATDVTATLEDVVVRDTLPQETGDQGGQGLEVVDNVQLVMRRATIERSYTAGISAAMEGTSLDLEDVTVRETASRVPNGERGRGIEIHQGAQASLRRGLVENNHDVGIFVLNESSAVVLEDVTVRGTLGRESDQMHGWGIEIYDGAQMELTRGLVEGNRGEGVMVWYDATATVEDLTVLDTDLDESDGTGGRGLEISWSGQLSLRRGLVDNNRDTGIFTGENSVVDLEDVVISNTRSTQGLLFGKGLEAGSGSRVTASRLVVEDNRVVGVLAGGAGTSIQVDDLVIQGTLPQESNGSSGFGALAMDGSSLEFHRARIEDNRTAGVFAADEGSVGHLEDVAVIGTLSQESDALFGMGVGAQLGGRIRLTRGFLDHNRMCGIMSIGSGADAQLHHVHIQDTLPMACVNLPPGDPREGCDSAAMGVGLGIYHEASVSFEGVVVERSSLAGAQIAEMGSLSGPALTVRDNPIGINIQTPAEGYSFFEQVTGLRMENNLVNFDAIELPVPDPLNVLR